MLATPHQNEEEDVLAIQNWPLSNLHAINDRPQLLRQEFDHTNIVTVSAHYAHFIIHVSYSAMRKIGSTILFFLNTTK